MTTEAPNLESAKENVYSYVASFRSNSPRLWAFTDELLLREARSSHKIIASRVIRRRIRVRGIDPEYRAEIKKTRTLWKDYKDADSNTNLRFFRKAYNSGVDAIPFDKPFIPFSLN